MPSTTTAPGRWPAAISSLTMLLIACAAPIEDGLATGGAAAAGVGLEAQATTARQSMASSSTRRSQLLPSEAGEVARRAGGVMAFIVSDLDPSARCAGTS